MVMLAASMPMSHHSCGVYDLGHFHDVPQHFTGFLFDTLPFQGCGIFRCSFTEDQRPFLEELKKHHTCLFESEPYTNMSPSCGYDKQGERNKIIVAVFLHKDVEKHVN